MRRIFVIGLLLACSAPSLHAKGDRKTFQLYDFSKGVDTYHNPTTLQEGFVQNSLNVLFDDVAPVTKRAGYTVAWSTTSTYAFTGLWSYTDASNTTWQLARSSTQITASNLAGTTINVATVSVSNLVGETNAFGNAYFTDQTQGVYFWNGTSTTYVTGSPKGSIIAQFHNRLWDTGLAVPNGNQLYGSKYYDGTTWTTGPNATDPVQYSIGLQDNFDNTTAEYVYLDTLYLFKHYSIFALYGFDQTNFQISQLTQECGCTDGGSIQTYNGGLKFVSLRGVEDFNGYTCRRISDQIKNKIDPAINVNSFNANSWILQTANDWNTGTNVLTDTTTIPGSVVLAGNNLTSMTSFYLEATIAMPNGTPAWSLYFINSSNNGYGLTGSRGGTHVTTSMVRVDAGVTSNITGGVSPVTDTNSHYYEMRYNPSGGSNQFQMYIDGSAQGSPASDNTYTTFSTSTFSMSGGATGNFTITSPTGTYISAIHNMGSPTSLGNFSVTDVLNGGKIVFSICSSTNSNMGAPTSCTSPQTPNAQLTISTGVVGKSLYVQYYSTFTVTVATQAPALSLTGVNAFNGGISIPMASTVWDNRYWLSITSNTADTGNDAVLVLNSKGAWAPLDIHAGAFTLYKNSLYHADSKASGNIYLDNQGFGDNGSTMNSFINTKNESLGDLAADDYFYKLYTSVANTGNCPMTVSYTTDTSTSTYSLGSPLLNEFSVQTSVGLPFPVDSAHQDFSQSVSFTLGTNDNSCSWNLFGLQGIYRSRPLQ